MHLEATVVPLNRVDSMEMLKQGPDTPGRGVNRMQTLYRTNSIIDGTEMEVGGSFYMTGAVYYVHVPAAR